MNPFKTYIKNRLEKLEVENERLKDFVEYDRKKVNAFDFLRKYFDIEVSADNGKYYVSIGGVLKTEVSKMSALYIQAQLDNLVDLWVHNEVERFKRER